MAQFGVFISCGKEKCGIIDSCKRILGKSDAVIKGAYENEVYKGIEVFFNSKSTELKFLKKKYLVRSNGVSTIHSLTTALALHKAFPSEEEDFKIAVRNHIQDLTSTQVLAIKKIPFSSEVPEIPSGKWIIILDVPEVEDLDVFKSLDLPDGVLKFPEDHYKITFYCRLCKKDGHIQFRCKSYASDKIHSGNINPEGDDKTGDDIFHTPPKRVKTSNDNLSSDLAVNISSQEIYPGLVDEPSSSTSTSTSTVVIDLSQSPSYDPSMDPPDQINDMFDPSFINPGPSAPRPRKVFQVVIPKNFRAIIADIPEKVLDIQQLEKFFIHAKKKLCPADIANQGFTKNVKGLYDQLKEIRAKYYNLPNTGSNDDKKFVKMLSNVIQRYYNGYKVPYISSEKLNVSI